MPFWQLNWTHLVRKNSNEHWSTFKRFSLQKALQYITGSDTMLAVNKFLPSIVTSAWSSKQKQHFFDITLPFILRSMLLQQHVLVSLFTQWEKKQLILEAYHHSTVFSDLLYFAFPPLFLLYSSITNFFT